MRHRAPGRLHAHNIHVPAVKLFTAFTASARDDRSTFLHSELNGVRLVQNKGINVEFAEGCSTFNDTVPGICAAADAAGLGPGQRPKEERRVDRKSERHDAVFNAKRSLFHHNSICHTGLLNFETKSQGCQDVCRDHLAGCLLSAKTAE